MKEERTAEGIRLLDSLDVAVRSEQPVDSALLDYISTARTFGLFNAGRLEEIEGSPSGAETGGEDDADADVCIISSRLAYEGGDRDAAASLLSKAYGRSENERELIKVRYETYWQHMASGNYKEAALLADTLLHVQGEIVEGILNESVTGVQRDFYSEKVRYQEQKSGYILRLLVMVVVTAIVITALLIGMYRLRIRASRAELEANVSSLLQLKEQMMCVGAENRRLSEELDVQSAATEDLRRSLELTSQAEKHSSEVIEYLFREKWSTLNMLCGQYFDIGDSPAARATALNNIGKELDKLRSRKNLSSIEDAVDMYMGNIMSMLRRECDFLKEDDLVFMSLLFAGLSSRAICLFLNMKYKFFYLKKSRLAKRIEASGAPHKDIFLCRMG